MSDNPSNPLVADLAIDFTSFVINRFNDEDKGWSSFSQELVENFEDEFNGLTGRIISDNLVLLNDTSASVDEEESETSGRLLTFRFLEVFVANYATEEIKNGKQILAAMVGYVDDTINPSYATKIESFVLDLVESFFDSVPHVSDKLYKITPNFNTFEHTVLSNNMFTYEVASVFRWELEFKVEHA